MFQLLAFHTEKLPRSSNKHGLKLYLDEAKKGLSAPTKDYMFLENLIQTWLKTRFGRLGTTYATLVEAKKRRELKECSNEGLYIFLYSKYREKPLFYIFNGVFISLL